MKNLFIFLTSLFITSCENKRPYKVVNVRNINDSTCEYVLSRSNGFGPQVKKINESCDKYKLFQTINF